MLEVDIMNQQREERTQALLKLLELLLKKEWEDDTVLEAVFTPKLWNKLIQDLEMNLDMSEEYFLELMEDF